MIAGKPGLNDLALTTNGVLLADQIDALKAAGLGRITVSLDTLDRERFKALTRFDQLDAVHAGIAAARRGFGRLKIDTVVIRGVNDDELVPLVEYGRAANAEVRFIEYMDVGGASRWSTSASTRGAKCSTRSRATTARSRRSRSRDRRRRRSGSRCPTARHSASLRRRPNRSAEPAIAVDSPPTACGICASTPRAGSICAPRCGEARASRS